MGDFLQKIRQRLIADKYFLIRKLGEGGFGAVYLARNVESEQDVALKLEHRDREPVLEEEYMRYAELQDLPGFPKVCWYGWHDDFKIMAMELLGPSLEDLLTYCGGRFSLKTTLMLADQLLERLNALHERGLLHRDIKPANCLLGIGCHGNTIYVTDFGLAQDYNSDIEEQSDDERNTEVDRDRLVGTARFASISGHHGKAQSPRDDLESLGYMLIYFLRGRLPWQGLRMTSETSKTREILKKKMALDAEELCVGLPQEFTKLMLIARGAHEGMLNYRKIRAMFRQAAKVATIEYDYVYDWTIQRYLELHNPHDTPMSRVAQPDRR